MQPAPPINVAPIGVLGLWHLGAVTAACLAAAGNEVVAVDPDSALVRRLAQGTPAVAEPGLAELFAECRDRLTLSSERDALAGLARVWVAFDTPVDDDDRADVEWVLDRCEEMLEPVAEDALVVVSSQLPVGSVARLAEHCARRRGGDTLRFACVPENLRLGDALKSFREPDRIVAGVRDGGDRDALAELLGPVTGRIEWMGVESAEMTKHALNGFLATSVAFINEVATICEAVGADAGEVARGLKSEARIGPRAYLAPGDAFAGGTLARDVGFLRELAGSHQLPSEVLSGVAAGNAAHKQWARRKLVELLDGPAALTGETIAVWGLTYKPGTDTLRRSSAVETCRWLHAQGATVRAHDPAISELPDDLSDTIELLESPLAAATGAAAVVLCTPWPAYREVTAADLIARMEHANVVDPAGFTAATLGGDPGIRYARVGAGSAADASVWAGSGAEPRP